MAAADRDRAHPDGRGAAGRRGDRKAARRPGGPADRPLDQGLDPLAADVDRSLAELTLLRGEAAAAADALARLAEAESESGGGDRGGPPRPAHGWTLVLLARAAARLGDAQRVAQCFRSVAGLAATGVDPYALPGLDEASLDLDV
jgi:hypothetical protein